MCIHDYLESIVHKSKMMKITEDRQQSVGQGYACDTPDGRQEHHNSDNHYLDQYYNIHRCNMCDDIAVECMRCEEEARIYEQLRLKKYKLMYDNSQDLDGDYPDSDEEN